MLLVGAFVLGGILAWPRSAQSKGQWCNDRLEGQDIRLTLEQMTIDGNVVPISSTPMQLRLKNEFVETDVVHADLAASDAKARVLHLVRSP
jgi:hypothetical protein